MLNVTRTGRRSSTSRRARLYRLRIHDRYRHDIRADGSAGEFIRLLSSSGCSPPSIVVSGARDTAIGVHWYSTRPAGPVDSVVVSGATPSWYRAQRSIVVSGANYRGIGRINHQNTQHL